MGYIGHERKRVGDVFYISKDLFSGEWMKTLDGDFQDGERMIGAVEEKVSMNMAMEDLINYCENNNLSGFSGLSKQDLVSAINNDELSTAAPITGDDEDVI